MLNNVKNYKVISPNGTGSLNVCTPICNSEDAESQQKICKLPTMKEESEEDDDDVGDRCSCLPRERKTVTWELADQ